MFTTIVSHIALPESHLRDEWNYSTKNQPLPGNLEGTKAWCFTLIIVHGVGVMVRPTVALILGFVHILFVATYQKFISEEGDTNAVNKGFHYFGCVIFSPFGQSYLAVRAFVGIFFPDAYVQLQEPPPVANGGGSYSNVFKAGSKTSDYKLD